MTWKQLQTLMATHGYTEAEVQRAIAGVDAAIMYVSKHSKVSRNFSSRYIETCLVNLFQAEKAGAKSDATRKHNQRGREKTLNQQLPKDLYKSPVKPAVHHRNELIQYFLLPERNGPKPVTREVVYIGVGMILISLRLRPVQADYADPTNLEVQGGYYDEELRRSYRNWNAFQLPGLKKGQYTSNSKRLVRGT